MCEAGPHPYPWFVRLDRKNAARRAMRLAGNSAKTKKGLDERVLETTKAVAPRARTQLIRTRALCSLFPYSVSDYELRTANCHTVRSNEPDSARNAKMLRCRVMHRRADQGWLEVISGPMFSGKSEELIRRVTRYHLARVPTQTFKPELDTRYAEKKLVSHSNLSVDAEPVGDSAQLLSAVEDRTIVVGIDEGQFFDIGLIEVATMLAGAGKQVIVAGLDLDYLGRPFEPIPSLLLRAEYVTKALAVCHRCGGPGLFTQRVVDSDELVVLGATDAYEARCRHCYDPNEAKQTRLQLVEE